MKQEQDAGSDPDFERIEKAVQALSEHFDSVQIFASRYDGGEGTKHVNLGAGHYFMRKSHVEEWLIKEDEELRERVRARMRRQAKDEE